MNTRRLTRQSATSAQGARIEPPGGRNTSQEGRNGGRRGRLPRSEPEVIAAEPEQSTPEAATDSSQAKSNKRKSKGTASKADSSALATEKSRKRKASFDKVVSFKKKKTQQVSEEEKTDSSEVEIAEKVIKPKEKTYKYAGDQLLAQLLLQQSNLGAVKVVNNEKFKLDSPVEIM